MLWNHSLHPGHRVRLGYCLNLHGAEDLDEVQDSIEAVTLPLRDRLRVQGEFGVGLYLAAPVARQLAEDRDALERFKTFLDEERIDPFTFNAFPFGGFHSDGLKEDVYRPTWAEPDRVDYTLNVARVAAGLCRPGENHDRHVSISTHPGAYGAWVEDRSLLRGCAEGLGRVVGVLAEIEGAGGPRIVLSLEAEPRASAGDSRALAEFLVFARGVVARVLHDEFGRSDETSARLSSRHLGTCLDACHSAVEFETPGDAFRLAHFEGPMGKMQVSSALALERPGGNEAGRKRLLDLDEPRFLHQVTSRRGEDFERLSDLPELVGALEGPDASGLLDAEEWRCHFHVPVDLAELGDGLRTTRDHADALVHLAASEPRNWHTTELHLEIETYTWSVLPASARGTGDLVDGLEREYRHVFGLLERDGWDREGSALERVRA